MPTKQPDTEALRTAQNASTALGGADPARAHAVRLVRGGPPCPRPLHGTAPTATPAA